MRIAIRNLLEFLQRALFLALIQFVTAIRSRLIQALG